jgi:hypothetical protein
MSSQPQYVSTDEALSQRYYNVLLGSFIAASCFLRRFSLFFRKAPQTPLRVLCIMAFDTLHVLTKSNPMSTFKVSLLASILDFAAAVNSDLDCKAFDSDAYRANRSQIDSAGFGAVVDDFLHRLRELESRGQQIVKGSHACDNARVYRESVVRLNLALLAVIVFDLQCLNDGMNCTYDQNFEILFKSIMQMQIIDDIIDYRDDVCAGLPGFLTVSELQTALPKTAQAWQTYRSYDQGTVSEVYCPFRFSLACTSLITKAAIQFAYWKYLPKAKR